MKSASEFSSKRRGGRIRASAAILPVILLAGCGGGGGGGDVGGCEATAGAQSTLLTALMVAPPEPTIVEREGLPGPRAGNDDFASAQAVLPLARIEGAVGRPVGAFAADLDDFFVADLSAGQVVLLEADGGAGASVDLHVYDARRQLVGFTQAGAQTERCLAITTPGRHYLNASLFGGAGGDVAKVPYRLRLAAAGTSACLDATAVDGGIVPGELIVRPGGPTGAHVNPSLPFAATARLSVIDTGAGASLLRLPPSEASRAAGLQALALATRQDHAPRSGRPAAAGTSDRTRQILDTLSFVTMLAGSRQYAYVTPNRLHEPLQVLVGGYPSNDPNYRDQRWHFEQIALPSALDLVAAQAPSALQRPIVAIIDSGVAIAHPDLQRQLVPGYDFVTNSAGMGDDPESDNSWYFHGTLVAGVAAAETYNATFGASTAPMAQLMSLRTGGRDGYSEWAVQQAIRFAARLLTEKPDRRADVINLSLGSRSSCSDAFKSVLADARAQGVIVVAASGNDADASPSFGVRSPANCPTVIAVGATNHLRARASYSSFGPELRLMAPGGEGENGVGTTTASYEVTQGRDSTVTKVLGFGLASGTSLAAPHATGVFALMRWVNPAITPAQVDDLISSYQIVDDLGAACRDNEYGFGLINARKAVEAALRLRP
jgi:serine protease